MSAIAQLIMAKRPITTFAQDSFTGGAGALTAHTPTIGGGWTEHGDHSTGYNLDGAGKAAAEYDNSVGCLTYIDDAPPSADYYVEATFTYTGGGGMGIGVAGRIDPATDSYYRLHRSGTTDWSLQAVVNGVVQTSWSYTDFFNSGTRTVRLSMIGDKIRGYIDGVLRLSPPAWSYVNDPGRAGLFALGDEVSTPIDNFLAVG